ncbi:MAG: hypothetical protein QW692_00575 [Nitrososphaerota archaeon]
MKLPFGRRKGVIFGAGKAVEQLEMREFDYKLGHVPPIDFKTMYQIYTKDIDVFSAANALAFMAAGAGVYVEADDERAREIINEFNQAVNLDETIFVIASEMVWGGNSFWYKVRDGKKIIGLQHIPLTRVRKIRAREDGSPEMLIMLSGGAEIEVPYSDLLHFYLIKVDKELFGSPLIRPIAEPRADQDGNAIPELYIMKWSLEDYIYRVIRKYPPRFHYKFDVSDEVLEKYANVIKNLRPGEDLVTNVDFKIESLSADPRSRFTEYIQHLDNKVVIGLMTVTHRLFTTPGFTEASANVAMDLQQLIIKGIQRIIKRKFEELYREILEYHGVDARVRLNFGEPQVPELEYDHILKFAELGVISFKEARRILMDKGWPLESKGEEALEALRPRYKWMDTLDEVICQLVDPSDIDYSTIRYWPIDSEKGIEIAVAWVRSSRARLPVAIFFSKRRYDWNVDKAKMWYEEAFPRVFWEKVRRNELEPGEVQPG